ncbi:hypothetical protein BC830DRAFT_1115314 [Chytriomyces sp. MP71]|nr:hypothetical protein BC830DRAFT_1115314 [Chytriomyces sp. MP71]
MPVLDRWRITLRSENWISWGSSKHRSCSAASVRGGEGNARSAAAQTQRTAARTVFCAHARPSLRRRRRRFPSRRGRRRPTRAPRPPRQRGRSRAPRPQCWPPLARSGAGILRWCCAGGPPFFTTSLFNHTGNHHSSNHPRNELHGCCACDRALKFEVPRPLRRVTLAPAPL